ncbi:anthranilate phosphoribosyltransferase [Lawsonibacter asaccharolyticus]|nr:anthranilate phosphoribosyltransferase [Lawsonibacter asaccharolyticus]
MLINLGIKRGMVVYGQDKLDEISLSAPTTICEIRDGWFKSSVITPEDFGFDRCTKEELKGGTPEENAAITQTILSGGRGAKRNAVLLNAGAALYIGGKADSMKDGVALAAELIDTGKAAAVLEQLIAVSNGRRWRHDHTGPAGRPCPGAGGGVQELCPSGGAASAGPFSPQRRFWV